MNETPPSRNSGKGRGSSLAPPNRFERIHIEDDFEHLEHDEEATSERSKQIATEYFIDDSETVISENNSPDISFRYSVNPYRGCAHGWRYFVFPLTSKARQSAT